MLIPSRLGLLLVMASLIGLMISAKQNLSASMVLLWTSVLKMDIPDSHSKMQLLLQIVLEGFASSYLLIIFLVVRGTLGLSWTRSNFSREKLAMLIAGTTIRSLCRPSREPIVRRSGRTSRHKPIVFSFPIGPAVALAGSPKITLTEHLAGMPGLMGRTQKTPRSTKIGWEP